MMMNTFFYEDGQENILNEQNKKACDPMKDVLMQANVPNIVLETITNRETYLNAKRPEKTSDETLSKKQSRSSEMNLPVKPYNNYNDFTRESFNYRMLESP
ncbi:uncharacterized protein RHIMIDRAFT_251537 [Rhizopus microsporus ATCC 52813]|uniref:Uncharacterized protein n=1 Tax=Rhizopus microsporus ATCC 52813 TaxID=1340429 RepID=A0A2G4SW31_RHIZD|nr:uncharacterized protein RHIMIDRAFT_251537 [Rhizopus microsporus ATCC 52813]PHZ12586.1 hypothetical protein RHIMIDRAFT_251537 [Rhizopus microsporus ATCC 52813]